MKNHPKSKTLQELAVALGATLRGDPNAIVVGLAPLERALQGELSFLTHTSYRKYLPTTQATAVILSESEAEACPVSVLITDNPRLSLVKAAELFENSKESKLGIHPSVHIGKNCSIPNTVEIGPNVVIGNAVTLGEYCVIGANTVIGDNCVIGNQSQLKAQVSLYDNVKMGDHCLIHSGVVIGSDGFGFANEDGDWIKMPHLGGVVIGNRVEIGANTTIDRGVFEDTKIGDGVIIDNLVQIGHNVSIGDRTAIAGCAGIAGSATIGKNCLIGGGACIGGHLEIADNVYLTAMSGVNHSLKQPGVYSSGLPAKPNAQWRRNVARFQYLDEMAKRLRFVENSLGIHAK